MKYIITESRLNEIMTEYMNSWISSKIVREHDTYIIVDSKLDEDEGDVPFMEYDSWDGRLWFMKYFRKSLMDLFNKSESEINEFVKNWFEHEFNVEVKFVA